MKKIILSTCTAMTLFFVSCNTDMADTGNKHSEQEQRNIAASDAISRAFETGDVSIIDSVVADDFVDHTDRGDVKGKDSLKAMVQMIKANFKDMKGEKVREVAEGDYVYTWMRYTGTSNGAMGMPAGPYDMTAMEVSRFNNNGKAVEHWGFMEMQSMAKMMQAQPATQPTTQPAPNTDTTQNKKY